MGFEIEVVGVLRRTVRNRLVDIVGAGAFEERADRFVVSVADQSAMIGLLHRLNDLGLDIERIGRNRDR